MYYLGFNTNIDREKKKVDFFWWKDLLKRYLEKGNYFEIRYWKDDSNQQVKELMDRYGIYYEEEHMEAVHTGMIDSDFRRDFLENCLDEEGYPIYFTAMIYKDEKLILSSEHYGLECYLFDFDRESVVLACDELESRYGIKDIAIYTDEDLTKEDVQSEEYHFHSLEEGEMEELIHNLEGLVDPNDLH
ncbi:MAG: hypothetical protein Q4P25_02530 [Tissierellia bacterium]|nr:hypothetical protein [Tissierellia bacterium]